MSTIIKKPATTPPSPPRGPLPGNGAGGTGGAGNVGPSGGPHGAGPLGDAGKGGKTQRFDDVVKRVADAFGPGAEQDIVLKKLASSPGSPAELLPVLEAAHAEWDKRASSSQSDREYWMHAPVAEAFGLLEAALRIQLMQGDIPVVAGQEKLDKSRFPSLTNDLIATAAERGGVDASAFKAKKATSTSGGVADLKTTSAIPKAQVSAQMQQAAAVKTQVFKAPPFDPKQPAEAQLLVAGTGIGGGPIARLAEQGFQVKFLEAGPPQRDWFCDVPALHGKASDDSFLVDGYSPPMALAAYFVQHYEEAQKNVDLKMHEDLGGILYPRGQGIGGSGNVNANVAVMPDKQTLEGLYVQSGKDPRFAPDNLQKFFARAQDPGPLFKFLQTMGHVIKAGHSVGIKDFSRITEPGGWQKITTALDHLGFKDLTADKQLGKIVMHMLAFTAKQSIKEHAFGDIMARVFTLFDGNNELNTGREGFTLMQISVGKDGKRSSVADRLKAVMATRPDTMSVECETKVHSLIFNKEGTRVEGMRVMKPSKEVLDQRQVIYALKQNVPNIAADKIVDYNQLIETETQKLRVLEQTTQPTIETKRSSQGYVLSAGAFEDPMILIRSGYGPKEVLDKLGIAPVGGVYHEAVGRNLKDRREITVVYHAKDKFALIDGLGFGKNPHNDEAMKVWEKSGRGAYATNGVVASYQFKSDPSQKEADIFAFFVPGGFRGYDTGYAVDGEKYPQTFTAILLDKNGNLINGDTDHPMSPEELKGLREKLGRVEPDPSDPNHMKVSANFNYQRPKPGENPPLYSAMVRMKELFKGQDILTETVPGDPFEKMSSTSMKDLLSQVSTAEMFPADIAKNDIRSAEDWFKSMDIPLKDKSGKDVNLTIDRDGTHAKLSIDGKPATEAQLASLTMYDGSKLDASTLKAALTRQFMIEFQFSQQWGHHANGTCAMGLDAQNNVIAPDFHVWGPDGKKIENLWIASASGTPAPVNPGPFIQLYIAAAIGEASSDAIGEQLRANENHLGRMSPLATRLPAEMSTKNTFGENLLIAIDRSRGHVGDSQGVLTGEALTQLIAMQKSQGFSKKDVELAAQVYAMAEAKGDKNAGILKVLADEARKMRTDQGLWLDIKTAVRLTGNHLTNDDVVKILGDVNAADDRAKTAPPGS